MSAQNKGWIFQSPLEQEQASNEALANKIKKCRVCILGNILLSFFLLSADWNIDTLTGAQQPLRMWRGTTCWEWQETSLHPWWPSNFHICLGLLKTQDCLYERKVNSVFSKPLWFWIFLKLAAKPNSSSLGHSFVRYPSQIPAAGLEPPLLCSHILRVNLY